MNNNLIQKNNRNAFVALCEYASNNNWCWKIFCTTCGHSDFCIAFSKIIRGQHPDDESFWPFGKGNGVLLKEMEAYRDFIGNTNTADQMKLASIVAEAKLSDIQAVSKFPDWLGYLGLVLTHCPNKNAQKILSDSFLSQFITLLKNDKEIDRYLHEKQSKQELLDINDLSKIESSMLANKG